MKLLMITRKVDRTEHLAGFIYNWVKKLGSQLEELRVISWQEGDSSGLPNNIRVFHLPTRQNKIIKIIQFKKLVWENLKDVDGVFCHQMPIYTIIAGPLAKLRGKKVVSWYMHRQIDWRVWLMEKISDVILSASKQSFRLASRKLVTTGHGIDVEIFSPAKHRRGNFFNIISVGRISPTKDYESMIKAIDILVDQGITDLKLTIIGDAGLAAHQSYFEDLKLMVERMNLGGKVEFLGPRPNTEVPRFLQQSDLFINMSGTGSLDKAVLEAMACGCLVLTSNEAFKDILDPRLIAKQNDPKNLAEKIKTLKMLSDSELIVISNGLIAEVSTNHNLDNLVKKIVDQFR
ncbi:MAG: glycosyltransferase family 4 protein [Candidatus Buchananbacteria bacterium]|nr:glycosyltransferase family 4 protein [Candidatus Buchananbacteria bacterium]